MIVVPRGWGWTVGSVPQGAIIRGISSGGRCNGAPAQRQGATTLYFAAFIRDLDGNKREAVTFLRS